MRGGREVGSNAGVLCAEEGAGCSAPYTAKAGAAFRSDAARATAGTLGSAAAHATAGAFCSDAARATEGTFCSAAGASAFSRSSAPFSHVPAARAANFAFARADLYHLPAR